jgi:hypothetical protein
MNYKLELCETVSKIVEKSSSAFKEMLNDSSNNLDFEIGYLCALDTVRNIQNHYSCKYDELDKIIKECNIDTFMCYLKAVERFNDIKKELNINDFKTADGN